MSHVTNFHIKKKKLPTPVGLVIEFIITKLIDEFVSCHICHQMTDHSLRGSLLFPSKCAQGKKRTLFNGKKKIKNN